MSAIELRTTRVEKNKMRRLLLASVSAVALAGFATAASAADMGRRPVYKAEPAPMAHVYNWTGLYIGAHGGWAWGDVGGLDVDGGFIGGQIGFNWQAPGSPFVFGVEFDSAWANIEGSAVIPGVVGAASEIDYQGSLRGRIGYAFGPALLYATGGLAWMHNDVAIAAVVAPGFVVGAADDNTHFGWTIGAGLEYAFAPNWSAKVEYLYADYGAETYFSGVAGGLDLDAQTHTVKVGLNYRFGWGAPVSARY
jgi:outer membrane immunogenic protein